MRGSAGRSGAPAATWVLDASPPTPEPPLPLDDDQRRVVAHAGGPLLVLAGPGTGKTATIVEAVSARIADPAAPLHPEQILVLTFGRRAATELRDRIARRTGGGALPLVATFHAFSFGLVLQHAVVSGTPEPPRLLSGAEEDVRIRELLLGAIEDGSIDWPDDLAGAVGTLALANEIRAVLARARELDIDPDHLARIGRASGRPAWAALGALARQDDAVLALEHALDYAELQRRALDLARRADVREALHRRYRAIYVDEVQDTDPTQMALLEALTGPATTLVAVGDPDQSIYAFRGAQVRGILRFPERFRTADGSPAPVAVLGTTRRNSAAIRTAALAALGSRGAPGLPADAVRAHRNLVCSSPEPGRVRMLRCDSEAARAAAIADGIRRAHVREGRPWSSMAVLVRSSHDLPMLHRALLAIGVPAVIARDEIPLRAEPAVAVLLAAASAAASSASLTEAQALDLLTGPLCGLDASQLRALGRALRVAARAESPDAAPPASSALLRGLLAGTVELPTAVRDDLLAPIARLRALLDAAAAMVEAGASPGAILWALWSGRAKGITAHGWPERLRAAALAGSRSAHHDLDAVTALFDAAERAEERMRGRVGLTAFLATLRSQQIPAESVAEREPGHDGVRVLTAHRAKGLEWDAVWIAGLEEGRWPDLRPRGSVLEPDRLTADGVGAPASAAQLLDEERRLLYVAITRARHEVVLAAVDAEGASDDAGQPSRFVDDIASALGSEPEPVSGRPRFPVTLAGVVAELRVAAADESEHPAVREAAIARLAALALERDADGLPLVPSADPATWWGIAPLTPGASPVRDPGAPVALSGSALESLLECPLRWFLEREAHADVERASSTAFGSIVHAIADYVGKGEVKPVLDEADGLVDRVWGDLRFDAPWQSRREREEAREAVERFLAYHLRGDRLLVATEGSLEAELEVPGPSGERHRVHLRGFVDRLERDAEGRLVPVDLKNMRRPPANVDLPEHAQLGVYQLLVREQGEQPGGAFLVQLRVGESKQPGEPVVQGQDALPSERPTWVELALGEAAETIRAESFEARTNRRCQWCAYRTSCPASDAGTQVVP